MQPTTFVPHLPSLVFLSSTKLTPSHSFPLLFPFTIPFFTSSTIFRFLSYHHVFATSYFRSQSINSLMLSLFQIWTPSSNRKPRWPPHSLGDTLPTMQMIWYLLLHSNFIFLFSCASMSEQCCAVVSPCMGGSLFMDLVFSRLVASGYFLSIALLSQCFAVLC